jgi:hypothetical protein
MAIVNVYIDGFNLYYGALKRTPYKWLDLGVLAQTLLPADTVQEIHYFTARVSSRPYNPTSATIRDFTFARSKQFRICMSSTGIF